MIKSTLSLLLIASVMTATVAHATVEGDGSQTVSQDLRKNLDNDLQDLKELKGRLLGLRLYNGGVAAADAAQIMVTIAARRGFVSMASDLQAKSNAGLQLAGILMKYASNSAAILIVGRATFNVMFDTVDAVMGTAETKALNAKIDELAAKIQATREKLGNN